MSSHYCGDPNGNALARFCDHENFKNLPSLIHPSGLRHDVGVRV
jgi:hypothetical protein